MTVSCGFNGVGLTGVLVCYCDWTTDKVRKAHMVNMYMCMACPQLH